MLNKILKFFRSYEAGWNEGYAEGMHAFTNQGLIFARNSELDEIMVEEPNGDWVRYKRVDENK